MPLRVRENSSTDTSGMTEDQRKDQISHFILRLAYCRTEDLRRWFLTQECNLLKFRLERLTEQERAEFMRANGIVFDQVSQEQKMQRKDVLMGLAGVTEESKFATTTFYKCDHKSFYSESSHIMISFSAEYRSRWQYRWSARGVFT